MKLLGFEIKRADTQAAIHVKESGVSNKGWIRLGQNQKYALQRDITREILYDTNDRAYKGWLYNPFVKRITETWVNYVVGLGLEFKAKDERVQAVIDQFLENNKIHEKMKKRAREAFLFAELFAVPDVNTLTGNVRLGFADPLNISNVEFDPFDGDTPIAIEIKTVEGKHRLPIVKPDKFGRAADLVPEFYGAKRAYIGKEQLVTIDKKVGRAIILQYNMVIGSSRGATELLPIIDWCAGAEDILWINKQRVEDQSAVVGVIVIEGATPKQLNEYRNPESPNYIPPPRRFNPNEETSWAYANEKIKFNFVSPDIKASDIETIMRTFKSIIQIGSGNPPVVFGEADNTTWAGAKETTPPFFQMLESAQLQFVEFWEEVGGFVIDQKRIFTNELNEVTDFGLSVTAPSIAVDDKKLLVEIARGLTDLVAVWSVNNWIDSTAAAKLIQYIAVEAELPLETILAPDPNSTNGVKESWMQAELKRIKEMKNEQTANA